MVHSLLHTLTQPEPSNCIVVSGGLCYVVAVAVSLRVVYLPACLQVPASLFCASKHFLKKCIFTTFQVCYIIEK